jgi:hypothetical protein
MSIRGSVDVVTAAEVRGWAFAPGGLQPVKVQAVLNNEILGEGVANIHRSDLAAAGLGDGNSGYAMKLFRPVDPLYFPFVTVKIDGGDIELPRAPMLGFAEFFAALHRNHPAAGRTRSVYGGLWIDRTDAAAVLRGKIGIGQLAEQAAGFVQSLIRSGFAILDLPATPQVADWRRDPAPSALAIIEQPTMLSVLHAVLEDDPLLIATDWVGGAGLALAQPSVANPSPSPAECLALVVPFEDDVALDVARDSHLLPEFSASGVSRWVTGGAALDVASANGLLDRRALPPGTVALVGPGTLFRVQGAGAAIRLLCLPGRLTPLPLLADPTRIETSGANGARAWLAS